MKAVIKGAVAVLAVFAATSAFAKEPTAQQNRMKSCNAEAKSQEMKGDARKQFMKSCLKGETAGEAPKQGSQQNKMKTCNADAKEKGLKGDERKAFMKSCLSN